MQIEATAIDPAWVPIYHRVNNDRGAGCGGVALYATRRVRLSDEITPENFRLIDGSAPLADDIPYCGACGSNVLDSDGWNIFADLVALVLEVP